MAVLSDISPNALNTSIIVTLLGKIPAKLNDTAQFYVQIGLQVSSAATFIYALSLRNKIICKTGVNRFSRWTTNHCFRYVNCNLDGFGRWHLNALNIKMIRFCLFLQFFWRWSIWTQFQYFFVMLKALMLYIKVAF